MSGRVARHDTRLGPHPVRAGQKVYLHVGAANHDPQVFKHPERFVEDRPAAHLGFGWGPTRCVGSEYALDCGTEYLQAMQSHWQGLQHHAGQDRFDHGLSARGLRTAVFSFTGPVVAPA